MKPIGILGGSFDPVHVGHLRMALELHAALDLAEVRFIPIHTHPFGKKTVASPQQRADMLALALADLPQCKLDTRELQRANVSYTVETLESLHAEVNQTPLCLFLGLDAFRQLDGWHRWDELLGLCHLVVVNRPDMSQEMANIRIANFNPAIQNLLEQHAVDSLQSLHQQRAGCILLQDIPALNISATRVRDSLKRNQSIRYLVPDAVLDYIQQHKPYNPDA